ncbi:MAG: Ig-like domain-containing protein [Flavobacterium sp.]
MRKLLLIFIFLTLMSCDESIKYDGEKRLVFQTVVKDANGTPLPNSYVELMVSNSYFDGSLISQGKTDQNGKITLIFPSPENDPSINLKIYNDNAAYMEKAVANIKKTDFTDYKFIYQNAFLLKESETATLNLTYSQTTPNTVVKNVGIIGIYQAFPEFYNYPSDYYEHPFQLSVKKNQSFQLKYTIFNMETLAQTEHIANLTIGNDPIDYNINY